MSARVGVDDGGHLSTRLRYRASASNSCDGLAAGARSSRASRIDDDEPTGDVCARTSIGSRSSSTRRTASNGTDGSVSSGQLGIAERMSEPVMLRAISSFARSLASTTWKPRRTRSASGPPCERTSGVEALLRRYHVAFWHTINIDRDARRHER